MHNTLEVHLFRHRKCS